MPFAILATIYFGFFAITGAVAGRVYFLKKGKSARDGVIIGCFSGVIFAFATLPVLAIVNYLRH